VMFSSINEKDLKKIDVEKVKKEIAEHMQAKKMSKDSSPDIKKEKEKEKEKGKGRDKKN